MKAIKRPLAIVRPQQRLVAIIRSGHKGSIRWRGVNITGYELWEAKDQLYKEGEIFAGPWRRWELYRLLERAIRNRIVG